MVYFYCNLKNIKKMFNLTKTKCSAFKFPTYEKIWAKSAKAAFFCSLVACHPLCAVESTQNSRQEGGGQKIKAQELIVLHLSDAMKKLYPEKEAGLEKFDEWIIEDKVGDLESAIDSHGHYMLYKRDAVKGVSQEKIGKIRFCLISEKSISISGHLDRLADKAIEILKSNNTLVAEQKKPDRLVFVMLEGLDSIEIDEGNDLRKKIKMNFALEVIAKKVVEKSKEDPEVCGDFFMSLFSKGENPTQAMTINPSFEPNSSSNIDRFCLKVVNGGTYDFIEEEPVKKEPLTALVTNQRKIVLRYTNVNVQKDTADRICADCGMPANTVYVTIPKKTTEPIQSTKRLNPDLNQKSI